MAGQAKDFNVFCVDVSPSMGQPGRNGKSHLQTSKAVMNLIVQQKMFAQSKDEFALVLFGTPASDNRLNESEGGYENISVIRDMSISDLSLLHYIEDNIEASTLSADFIDCIVVAMDILAKAAAEAKKVGQLKLFLFTDAASGYSDDGLDLIVRGLTEKGIQLLVVGPQAPENHRHGDQGGDDNNGHGDDGYHGNQTNLYGKKTARQVAGEHLLSRIVQQCEGDLFSFGEALKLVSVIQTRSKRQTSRFTGCIEIGPKLKIDCKMFTKVMSEKPPSWKKLSAVSEVAAVPGTMVVKMERTYHKQDEEEIEVDKEEVVKGYRYGKSLIPISAADEEEMKMQAARCLQVLGFTDIRNAGQHLYLGTSISVLVASSNNDAAMSSLVRALYEMNCCAIARYVWRANSTPKIVALKPIIKSNYHGLMLCQLPFNEDLRPFYFSPLTTDKTQPSDDQLDTIDDLITTMDLMEAFVDEEGECSEAYKPKMMFNPLLQRRYHCVRQRALHPKDPLPEPDPLLSQYLQPSEDMTVKATGTLQKISDLFRLSKVEQKGKAKRTAAELWSTREEISTDGPVAKQPHMMSKSDEISMASLRRGVVSEVGTQDPVKDFMTLLGRDSDFVDTAKQLHKVIFKLVKESFGDVIYPKALDCVRTFRQQSIKYKQPDVFNTFLKEMKEDFLGTRYSPFWTKLIDEAVSMVTNEECAVSHVTSNEAKQLMVGVADLTPSTDQEVPQLESEEADDLLEMM